MNLRHRDRSIVDIIFMITVFGVFMLSALFVVLFGAKIYKRTAHDMSVNFSSRTSLAYVTEKLHQHDRKNGVEIIEDMAAFGVRIGDVLYQRVDPFDPLDVPVVFLADLDL